VIKQRKLRVGVVGVGAVVREIYQHLYFRSDFSDLLEITAVAAPSESRRDWFGDLASLPANRRFASLGEMIKAVNLDAVQINTPDHLHCAPAVEALSAGLDVVVPKPAASTLQDVHKMIEAARNARRFLGTDFHKREDPRIKEAAARYQTGRYGQLQAAVFYMLDKLLVADPNHRPRFFASSDYAEKNSPISFLTVHMADALMHIVNLMPIRVRAIGYAHKLPVLKPIAVNGYDLVDTEITFETGATAHILTGWALPNTAWSTTVQSGRLICSEGLLDLALDMPGLVEIHSEGVTQINPLFRNFEQGNRVTGYGISSPGRLYERILARRHGRMSDAELDTALGPIQVGLYATLILEAAERSLLQGEKLGNGATLGQTIDLRLFAAEAIGRDAASGYGLA